MVDTQIDDYTPVSKAKLKKKYKKKSAKDADTSPYADSESLVDKDDSECNSLLYEEKSKSRVLKCLSFNLLCQLLIVGTIFTSIVLTPWLIFDVKCITSPLKTECPRVNLSIFFAWIEDN